VSAAKTVPSLFGSSTTRILRAWFWPWNSGSSFKHDLALLVVWLSWRSMGVWERERDSYSKKAVVIYPLTKNFIIQKNGCNNFAINKRMTDYVILTSKNKYYFVFFTKTWQFGLASGLVLTRPTQLYNQGQHESDSIINQIKTWNSNTTRLWIGQPEHDPMSPISQWSCLPPSCHCFHP
jgi:hypothetical protein